MPRPLPIAAAESTNSLTILAIVFELLRQYKLGRSDGQFFARFPAPIPPAIAFPTRQYGGYLAVADHVDGGAAHIEQRIDSKEQKQRRSGQAQRRRHSQQHHERASGHARYA